MVTNQGCSVLIVKPQMPQVKKIFLTKVLTVAITTDHRMLQDSVPRQVLLTLVLTLELQHPTILK